MPIGERSERIDLGAGFQLVRLNQQSWRLTTPFAPDGWTARQPGGATRSAFPGTALRFKETWWEIVEADTQAQSESTGVRYRLAPWNDAEVFRGTGELTAEACSLLAKNHRERVQQRRRGGQLMAIAPLVGLLPGEDQSRLERNFGVTATRTTAVSAFVVLGLATLAAGIGFAARRGVDFGAWQPLARALAPWWMVFVYLALESVVRLRVAWSTDMPCGTALIVLPVMVFRVLGRGTGGAAAAASAPSAAPPGHQTWTTARDVVHPLKDGCLEIRSRLAKEHWTLGITGIAYQGMVYMLLERSVIDTPAGPRHRFVLEPLPADRVPPALVAYHPEEVRDLHREQQRVRTAMWVESMPFLWGLLGEDSQNKLAAAYRYDPQRWTRFSIVCTGLLGAFNTLAPWLRGSTGLLDFLVVLAGLVLIWDTGLRARALQLEVLRPSIFGRPFVGAARRALRWAPRK